MGRESGNGLVVAGKDPIVIPRLDDPFTASVDDRDEHLMLLEAARHALDVEWTETLGAADDAGDHDVMGYPSTVAYLKYRMRMAGNRAHHHVKRARAAIRHVATATAWKFRQISTDQADLLFRAADRWPDDYRRGENVLLEIVGDSVEETKQVIDYWRNDVDLPGVQLDIEEQLRRRHLEVTRRHNGMVAGEFELPSMAGETFLAVIDALMPPPADNDSRTTGQRRADALDDLARDFLGGSGSPVVGGERPHLNVHVDLEALEGRMGTLHETEGGVVLDSDSLRTIVCDSSVSRIVFGPGSDVLDVGRKTRVVPAALRRGVIARDRHCTWSGCTRSPRWCDVHHVVSWADGGDTVITNLCLLCRYHHTLTHLEITPDDEMATVGMVGAGHRRRP